MTLTTNTPEPVIEPSSMTGANLPPWTPWTAYGIAIGALVIGFLALPFVDVMSNGLILGLAFGIAAGALAIYIGTSARVEGRRKSVDRFVTLLVIMSFVLALAPLLSLLLMVLIKGLSGMSWAFLTTDMRNIPADQMGGVLHAVVGTVLITAASSVIAIPIGIFTAIYVVEYGEGTRLAHSIRFLVDVMTGIPSIVAGLFAASLFLMIFPPRDAQMGIAGAVALAVLMVPIVVRSTEEMLKLVPNELREASYALGVPKWATIVRVVLPTALAGIATGVTLAIARIIGETAPLLVTVGASANLNTDLFYGWMETLPVFVYNEIKNPAAGDNYQVSLDRGWAAALILLIMVVGLNLVARIISHYFSPKGER